MQTLDITLAVGGLQQFDIGGGYFELIEGSGPVDVNFTNSDGSRAGDLEMLAALPGYWVSGPFSRFELKNRHSQPQTVRVMYGRGVGGSRRVQGAVNVIDGGRIVTVEGRAFIGTCSAATVAGQTGYAQVWNGTTKNLNIKVLTASAGTLSVLSLRSATAALANLAQTARSKLLGAAPIAGIEMRQETNAASLGVYDMANFEVQAVTAFRMEFQEPVVIPPGAGFMVRNTAVNSALYAVFEGTIDA